jgi:hypothetical protein
MLELYLDYLLMMKCIEDDFMMNHLLRQLIDIFGWICSFNGIGLIDD